MLYPMYQKTEYYCYGFFYYSEKVHFGLPSAL